MKNLAIICLGTTKIKGDSVGPLIGQKLKNINAPFYIYGTQNRQINALNYRDYFAFIEKQHQNDLIIVVDATLGEKNKIGQIVLCENGIKPGGAFDESRSRIGDIGIMAVVGDSEGERLENLKNVQDSMIEFMVKNISELLIQTYNSLAK